MLQWQVLGLRVPNRLITRTHLQCIMVNEANFQILFYA